MDLIEEGWGRYRDSLRSVTDEAELVRLQMTFYVGAMFVARSLADTCDQTGEDIDQGFLEAITQEGVDFVVEMRKRQGVIRTTH